MAKAILIDITQQESEFTQTLLIEYLNRDPMITVLEQKLIKNILRKLEAAQGLMDASEPEV